jgi:hypothetical protein
MNNCGTDLLFPAHAIPSLVDARGENWRSLVDTISLLDPESIEIMAFTLLMVRIGNCTFCNSDSYRAMHGCIQCARQALHRFRGSDEDLIAQFNTSKSDVEEYLEKKNKI